MDTSTPSNGRSFQPNHHGRHQIGMENNKDQEDTSNSKDLLGSLTKVPNTKHVPESLVDLSIKTKSMLLPDAKSLATCKKTVQNSTDHPQEDITGPKKFEDYTYTYSGPDVQPPLPMTLIQIQQMATNYDQALGAIKDSLSTANPLASLNL